jgi:hypothetical protein
MKNRQLHLLGILLLVNSSVYASDGAQIAQAVEKDSGMNMAKFAESYAKLGKQLEQLTSVSDWAMKQLGHLDTIRGWTKQLVDKGKPKAENTTPTSTNKILLEVGLAPSNLPTVTNPTSIEVAKANILNSNLAYNNYLNNIGTNTKKAMDRILEEGRKPLSSPNADTTDVMIQKIMTLKAIESANVTIQAGINEMDDGRKRSSKQYAKLMICQELGKNCAAK